MFKIVFFFSQYTANVNKVWMEVLEEFITSCA